MSTQPSVIVPYGARPLSHNQTLAPTTEIPSVKSSRISRAILEVFRSNNYEPIDLEALLFVTLRTLNATIYNYEAMKKLVKDYVLENFNIKQGAHLRLQEISMRNLTVGYSHTI